MVEPLVPQGVDLRDFGFMPLDVLRLRDSDLAALSSGDEFKGAVLLWCAAWHQVPAGSLPKDDRLLARLSGAGASWRKIRDGALRGFVECSDGRLYHPVIAAKAIESWLKKQAQRERTAAATAAREARRREQQADRDVQRNVQRNVERDEERNVQRDVHQGTVKGQGQGQGQGEKDIPPKPPASLRAADLAALGVNAQIAADFMACRKAKRLPLTQTALDGIGSEARSAGLSLNQALHEAVNRGWGSFRAEWLQRDKQRRNGTAAGKLADLQARNTEAVEAFVRGGDEPEGEVHAAA
jgi:hypothetical protein